MREGLGSGYWGLGIGGRECSGQRAVGFHMHGNLAKRQCDIVIRTPCGVSLALAGSTDFYGSYLIS